MIATVLNYCRKGIKGVHEGGGCCYWLLAVMAMWHLHVWKLYIWGCQLLDGWGGGAIEGRAAASNPVCALPRGIWWKKQDTDSMEFQFSLI